MTDHINLNMETLPDLSLNKNEQMSLDSYNAAVLKYISITFGVIQNTDA